ncbi:MAG TPA: AAA family ATPase [Nocardioides sp.]
MARTVYIAALEQDTGKSVVALGVMEMLAGLVSRVGFFRPIITDSQVPDPLVQLFTERYQLDVDPIEMHGVTYDDVHELTSAGRIDELIGRVVERFRAIERRSDAALCVGSDFTDVAAPTEFALNLRLADNLGAPVLAVVSGARRSAADVVGAVHVARDALTAAGNAVVAIIANRVEPSMVDEVRAAIAADDSVIPTYVVPSDPVLAEPTVGEVAAAVGATLLVGNPAELDKDVSGVIVGAATLPSVLDRLSEGALVITPGDRSEIVLGLLAAAGSTNVPASADCCSVPGWSPSRRYSVCSTALTRSRRS